MSEQNDNPIDQPYPYDMLSDLRDYLEDSVHEDAQDGDRIEVELSVEEIAWILDRIYEAKSGPSVGTDIDNYSDEDD